MKVPQDIITLLTLHDSLILLRPLLESDFEELYAVAADPLIWEQHPARNRHEKAIFTRFFTEAIESRGAYIVIDISTQAVIGCTRYYDYDLSNRCVTIGYTFLARSHWGGVYNSAMKKLMIDYAWQYVDTIRLLIGAQNIRSQRASEKIGAIRVATMVDKYEYRISKSN